MTDIEKLVNIFVSSLDINQEYDNKELVKQFKQTCKLFNKTQKKERPLSDYNIFVKDKMKELKETEPFLTSRERMKKIGKLWTQYKVDMNIES